MNLWPFSRRPAGGGAVAPFAALLLVCCAAPAFAVQPTVTAIQPFGFQRGTEIEVQLLGGGGSGNRPTGNVCTPGTHYVKDGQLVTRHCVNSTSKTYHGDQWVAIEVEVRGNESIKHVIDGETIFEYSQPQLDEKDANARKLIKDGDKMLHGGSISLQSESHPIEFRKVELRVLED